MMSDKDIKTLYEITGCHTEAVNSLLKHLNSLKAGQEIILSLMNEKFENPDIDIAKSLQSTLNSVKEDNELMAENKFYAAVLEGYLEFLEKPINYAGTDKPTLKLVKTEDDE